MKKEYPQSIAKRIIEENRYMTLSTASLGGKPWISPVFFSYDEQFNLYWVSNKEALHSKLIRTNPNAVSKLTEGEYINGQYVDKRVDLALFCK